MLAYRPVIHYIRDMPAFCLTKWYLDCVTPSGDVLIGYAALLQIGVLKLPLAGQLRFTGGHAYSSAAITRRFYQPHSDEDYLHWQLDRFNINGAWRRRIAPAKRCLFRNGRGEINWTAVHPAADVILSDPLHDGITGLGYAERLDMGVPLWQLGLRTLLWGRFVSPTDSIIWIQWEGKYPISLVLVNGTDVPSARVESGEIFLGDCGQLVLAGTQVLRHGPISDTVLSRLPLVRAVLPAWLSQMHETKWLSRGTWQRPDGATSTGWVIHESVSFNS